MNVRPKISHGGFSEQLKKIGLPKLYPDEQKRLVEKIISAKTDRTKSRLAWKFALHNTGFVCHAITRYFPRYVNDETFMDGLYGLYVAATRFKKVYGHQTYCISYIFGYVQRGLCYTFTQLSPSYRPDKKHHRTEIPIFGAFQHGHYYPDDMELVQNKLEAEMATNDEVLRQLHKEEREDAIKQIVEDFFEYLRVEKKWDKGGINVIRAFAKEKGERKRAAKRDKMTIQNVYSKRSRARILFKRYLRSHPEIRKQVEEILLEEAA
jgi:hypothetical protein